MRELYFFVCDPDKVRVLAMIFSCLGSLGMVAFTMKNIQLANLKVSATDHAFIYFFGAIAFFSGVLVLGFIIVPRNAESLLDLLRVKWLVEAYSRQVQALLKYLISLAL